MEINEKYQRAVLVGMKTYNQTEGDLEYTLVKALEAYEAAKAPATRQPVDCREAFAKYCENTQEKYEKICGQMLHYTSAIRYLAEKLDVCPYKMTWDAAIATKREAVTHNDLADYLENEALVPPENPRRLATELLQNFDIRSRG